MLIATWNVNSLRVRLPQLVEWLQQTPLDVLALQETKTTDEAFPRAAIERLGYDVIFSGQKTYNGVATLLRRSAASSADVARDIPGLQDPQRRVLALTVGSGERALRVINVYVPNGQSLDSDKYFYKLDWLDKFRAWLADEATRYPHVVVLGDFNIAPEDRDVHDPILWQGQVLVSERERAALRAVLAQGYSDVFRKFPQADKSFSWWDYRGGGFRRNHGLRIDLIIATEAAAQCCTESHIDREPRMVERPSDHTPVLATFDI